MVVEGTLAEGNKGETITLVDLVHDLGAGQGFPNDRGRGRNAENVIHRFTRQAIAVIPAAGMKHGQSEQLKHLQEEHTQSDTRWWGA